jgi:hypothetical protein
MVLFFLTNIDIESYTFIYRQKTIFIILKEMQKKRKHLKFHWNFLFLKIKEKSEALQKK